MNEFRKMFRKSGFTVDFFLSTLIDIYGEFSDRAAHNIPFPKKVKPENIEEMFRDLGKIPNRPRIAVVNLLLEPLPFNPQISD